MRENIHETLEWDKCEREKCNYEKIIARESATIQLATYKIIL